GSGHEAFQVNIAPEPDFVAKRSAEKKTMTFGSVRFEGRLRVTEPEQFREILAAGMGSAKAYGFGLLSVAPG
ncbi:MAG: type I-E CRISPR-associated protein Cas6/Cse3/CasE, partial [bacterium]|nr:type I-E CRISPR-associated protein Cas6/Cse3/CasE [bacterium]